MTTEEVKRRAELYSALAEGKTIQVKNMDGEWTDVKPEELNYIPEELAFRIKSGPKYRPFRTQEECWEEMHNHPDFGWIKDIVRDEIVQIMRISDEVLNVLDYTISPYAFGLAFQTFVFTDGTPFGIKEE